VPRGTLRVTMKVEILMSPGCRHGRITSALVGELLLQHEPGATIETIEVATVEDAARLGFLGSPTVRVDGVDIDPRPPASVGLG
jgi:hypothetical protein